MSYPIVTTAGFIIYSEPRGEADKLLHVFTREIGLILASAKGIRLEKSKLRYFAQDFSFATFSFVRGRELWRLTDAGRNTLFDKEGVEAIPKKKLQNENIIVKIARILRRLLHGEEANEKLFDCIQSFFIFEPEISKLDENEKSGLETLIMTRILHFLGYLDKPEFKDFVDNTLVSMHLIHGIMKKRTELNRLINAALRASHL